MWSEELRETDLRSTKWPCTRMPSNSAKTLHSTNVKYTFSPLLHFY